MTRQEALAVALGILTEISKAAATTTPPADVAPAAASLSVAPTVTFSSDCANGGTVSGSASYTSNVDAAGTGSVNVSMTVTPQACKVSNGTKLITVGGQWTFDLSSTLNQGKTVGDIVWHGKGNLTWDDGNCNIDYTMTLNLSPPAHGTITGTFCGASLNGTVSVPAPPV